MTDTVYLTDHRTTPYDFLATFYDTHFVSDTELSEAYDDWCEVHDLNPGTGEEREAAMLVWARQFMDRLTDEDWLPNAISEHAMEHWNMFIALAQTDWQLTAKQMTCSQQALDEYAGIIVFEDDELGDEGPLRVQFGHYLTSPAFITDCHDVKDVWLALGLDFPAAQYN